MDKLSYALCAVTAALCALLLLRAWARARASMLLWSGLCFVALTISNTVLVIDRLVVPDMDLSLWRHSITLLGVLLLLGGLIFGSDGDPGGPAVNELLLGGAATGFFVAGMIFLHYGLATRDRFFYFFTASFWLESANRVHIALGRAWSEAAPEYYYVRLLAYALILVAIWDKNRRR